MSGASSLLSKYTILSNSIAATRQTITSDESKLSSLEHSLSSLQSEHRVMQHGLSTLMKESKTLSKSLAFTGIDVDGSHTRSTCTRGGGTNRTRSKSKSRSVEHLEYQNLIHQEAFKRETNERIQLQLERLKQNRKLSRREFLQLCREFRMAVRKARISLAGFEEDDRRKQEHERGGMSVDSKSCPGYDCNAYGNDHDDNSDNQDHEMSEAIQQKQNSSQMLQTAQQRLQVAQTQHQNISKRANDRVDNLQRQRNQLERVRNDVAGMERELLLLEQDTKECEQISEGYAKGKMRSL
jgi:hypothetical protein